MSEAERWARWWSQRLIFDLIRVSLSKTLQSPKKAKKRTGDGASSNVFSMFEQAQIQEFKEVSARPKCFFFLLWLSAVLSVVNVWLCILESQRVTILFLQAFTIMDQNRDGFIDKNDLRDTFAALGKITCVSACVTDYSSSFSNMSISSVCM